MKCGSCGLRIIGRYDKVFAREKRDEMRGKFIHKQCYNFWFALSVEQRWDTVGDYGTYGAYWPKALVACVFKFTSQSLKLCETERAAAALRDAQLQRDINASADARKIPRRW